MHNVQRSQHKGHKSQVTAHKSIYYRYTSQSDRNKSRHLTQNQLLCKVLQTSCIERDKPTKMHVSLTKMQWIHKNTPTTHQHMQCTHSWEIAFKFTEAQTHLYIEMNHLQTQSSTLKSLLTLQLKRPKSSVSCLERFRIKTTQSGMF